MSKAAMKLALEALNSYHGYMEPLTTIFGGPRVPIERSTTGKVEQAITVLQEALAEQPAQQEPVAWMVDVDLANYQGQSEYRTILAWNAKPVWSGTHEINEVLKAVPLYTSPPAQRTWVDLTDDEIKKEFHPLHATGLQFARAVLAKSKEKNA